MDRAVWLLGLLATLGLGLTGGALLTEAMVLAPFWRSMSPEGFLGWYETHAPLLFRFFAPLEVGTTVLVGVIAVTTLARRTPDRWLWALAILLCVFVLITFPLYFKDANASFEQRTIHVDDVRPELRRWAAWHWARTVAAIGALVSAAGALTRR